MTNAELVAQIRTLLDQIDAPAVAAAEPLIQPVNLRLRRAFKVTEKLGDGGFSFAAGPIAISDDGGSLYVGNRAGQVAELLLAPGAPMTWPATAFADLPALSMLVQPFRDPTAGKYNPVGTSGFFPSNLGGLLALPDGRLHCAAYLYYDGDNAVLASHLLFDPSVKFGSTDWFPLLADWPGRKGNMQGYVGGRMCWVPEKWQTKLGGAAIASGFGLPIETRESNGPNAIAFDPMMPNPAVTLLNYPNDHPALGTYTSTPGLVNPQFNMATGMGSPLIVPGWRTLLFVYRTGMGAACYGPGTADKSLVGTPVAGSTDGEVWCYDPFVSDKGGHAYPNAYYAVAYDLDDLAAVRRGEKLPWDVLPYAQWELVLPFSDQTFKSVCAAVDMATGEIVVMQANADPGESGYFDGPVFYVFEVK